MLLAVSKMPGLIKYAMIHINWKEYQMVFACMQAEQVFLQARAVIKFVFLAEQFSQ